MNTPAQAFALQLPPADLARWTDSFIRATYARRCARPNGSCAVCGSRQPIGHRNAPCCCCGAPDPRTPREVWP